MEIVSEFDDCEKPHLKELLRSGVTNQEFEYAVLVLTKQERFIDGLTRRILRGAYIVSDTERDRLYELLNKPIVDRKKTLTETDTKVLLQVVEAARAAVTRLREDTNSSDTASDGSVLPCLYSCGGGLNEPYRVVLEHSVANNWGLALRHEKPLAIYALETEADFVKKLQAQETVLVEKILKFMKYSKLDRPCEGELQVVKASCAGFSM